MKMFGIPWGGGANFFGDIYMYTYACTCLFFTCVKLKFVLEPKKLLQKINGWNMKYVCNIDMAEQA